MPSFLLAQPDPLNAGDVELKSTFIEPIKSPVANPQLYAAPVLNGEPDHRENLPSEAHCLAHLALLESFVGLKIQVQSLAEKHGIAAEAGWARYLKKSVAKFTDWVSSRNLSSDESNRSTVLPQLDVLMVWHAFMLNTLKYAKFERMTNFKLPRQGIDWDLTNQTIDLSRYMTDNSAAILESLMNADDEPTATTEQFQFTAPTGLASFPFDLEAAVQRQSSFSLQMGEFAWHRSPYAADTMRRSIKRYTNFFSLIALGADTKIVPTLDVDLAWHTHQLNPEMYRAYSASITGGRVVNHDDTIGDEVLAPAFAATSTLFQTAFGGSYGLCFCWACEVGRSGGVSDLAEIECLVKDESSRREAAGLTVDLGRAMPACDKCGTHPTRGCHKLGGPADETCGNCGNSPCTCGGGGGSCYGPGQCSNCSGGCGGD